MNGNRNVVLLSVVIASVALIGCSLILARPLDTFVSAKKSITITGSAKKQIRSDLGIWRGSFSREAEQLPAVYAAMKEDAAKVKAYLMKKGIPENDIVFQPVSTEIMRIYDRELLLKLGKTDQISGYRM